MVGVAGRSKGCVTCRQRRVKCDETHPECNRCKKAKRVCGGYVQNNFIDGLPSGVRKAAKAHQQPQFVPARTQNLPVRVAAASKKPLEQTIRFSATDTEDDISDDSSSNELAFIRPNPFHTFYADPLNRGHQTYYDSSRSLAQGSIAQGPTQSLNLSAFQDWVYLNFTGTNIMKGIFTLNTPSANEISTPMGALNLDCLLSISTAYFGFQHRDQRTINLGMQRYGKALTSLNKALMHPIHSQSSHLLNSVSIMMLYELLAPTSLTGWVEHILGLERLMVYRGPDAHVSGVAHSQFVNNRSSILFACLAVEQPCQLASPEWMTVPWSLEPDKKTAFQRLLDIAMNVPELMAYPTRFGNMKSPSVAFYQKVFRVNKEFKAMLTQLEEWWDLWYSEHEHHHWLVSAEYEDLEADCTPTQWDEVYEFSNLLLANEFAVFQALKVLIIRASRYIDSLDPEVRPGHLDSMHKATCRAAIEICRSVDYHMQKEHRGGGSLLLLFPFRLAWVALGGNTPEGRWLRFVTTNSSRGVGEEWTVAPDLIFGRYETRNGDIDEFADG